MCNEDTCCVGVLLCYNEFIRTLYMYICLMHFLLGGKAVAWVFMPKIEREKKADVYCKPESRG